jgi:hypothetical protein
VFAVVRAALHRWGQVIRGRVPAARVPRSVPSNKQRERARAEHEPEPGRVHACPFQNTAERDKNPRAGDANGGRERDDFIVVRAVLSKLWERLARLQAAAMIQIKLFGCIVKAHARTRSSSPRVVPCGCWGCRLQDRPASTTTWVSARRAAAPANRTAVPQATSTQSGQARQAPENREGPCGSCCRACGRLGWDGMENGET